MGKDWRPSVEVFENGVFLVGMADGKRFLRRIGGEFRSLSGSLERL